MFVGGSFPVGGSRRRILGSLCFVPLTFRMDHGHGNTAAPTVCVSIRNRRLLQHHGAVLEAFDATVQSHPAGPHLLVSSSDTFTSELPSLPITLLAILLLVASQLFINRMLSGDQGLGAYLKDGRGVGKSSFRPLSMDDKTRAVASDPLPWLKLPKLDYVQVAGQEDEEVDSSLSMGREERYIDGQRESERTKRPEP